MRGYNKLMINILISGLLVGCSSSPTGRSQVLLFSSNQMNMLGTQSFEDMKKKQTIVTDPKVNRYVRCVADAITAHVPKAGFNHWDVVVFDSQQVNAFALPGGKIGVYTGLLKVAKNQDQLAAVIGHEVSHVLAEHGNERMSQSQLTNVGLQLSSYAIGASEFAAYKDVAIAALGVGAQYGILLPYSRRQESEADLMGVALMAKSGFNPNESIALWHNMAKASKGNAPLEFMSTHPANETRIENLQKKIKQLPQYPISPPRCHR